MIFYVANYAAGVGNVPWQQGELFSMETRGIGTSVATATNWSCNLLIGATYLSLMQAITPAGAFGFYAGLCALGWVACFFGFPDTKRLSLEEVQSIFKDSWGIQAADDLRAEKDRLARGEPLDAGASASQRTSGETEVREVRRTPASTVTGRRGSTAAANTAAATPEQRKSVEADRDETSAATSAVETRSAWAPPLGGVVKMSGSSAAVPSNIPASAMSRSTSPHARRGSAQTNHSRASSAASGRSVFVPRVSMEEGKTSPLAKMGIKGDGLMLFITCFASLGVFLFGYDQGVMSGKLRSGKTLLVRRALC